MKRVILMLLCLGFILPVNKLFAQKQNIGISLTPQIGFLLQHRATMAHLNLEHSYGGQLEVDFKTNGKKQWHHDFNFPTIELNTFYYDLGNKEVLGKAIGLSAGIYFPYFLKNGWSVGNAVSFGLTYITKKYDLIKNPKNNVIGSNFNCMVNLGIRVEKQFSKSTIGLEISMAHLSNGAYRLPNLGVNLPFLGLSYTYFLDPIEYQENASQSYIGLPLKKWSFSSQLIGSIKQIYPIGGSTYGVAVLTNYGQYRVNTKVVIEGGVDAIYNESIVKYNNGNHGKGKNFQLGLYAAYVLPIHKLHLIVAMGRYVINPLDPAGQWFHKFGGRFRLTERLWGNFTIKSHWAKADYFEYGLSYRWK
ncbi:hypothetical protein ERX46_16280 [Brumimicrobium glaciale]|uniref:Acyloxyacyl hydrolase n=1 Tax=Brumimicrobium glaciale TaxID=200475 RepID=A0A4Q4KH04_9FLAO|nr:acyloxyacyl hydrolase [Brumimicrobium glaciale]RYM31464.1 hypothetical protein ERX46_16280 [Brumimicrobium glaciale]